MTIRKDTNMKKRYQPKKKSTSYKIRLSTTYGSVSGKVYALLINGKEIAWGSKSAIEVKHAELIKTGK
jgi:hypothetical protein